MTLTAGSATDAGSPLPHRRALAVAGAVIALAGAAGAVQLATGTKTPPVEDLRPLGLRSWLLPGIWLGSSVALPWAVASVLASRGHDDAPVAVLVASGALLFELAVQIPFVGKSPLQALMGGAAVGLATVALDARRRGWRRH